MCRVLKVTRSGFYSWLKIPISKRAKENNRVLTLIKQLWLESSCVYGYRKIHDDLQDFGETCYVNTVAKLMQKADLKARIGYKRRKGYYGGKPAVVAPNFLKRNFKTNKPNTVWVTDITYIKTCEGWLYLTVIIDLYSRKVVGYSMQSRMDMKLVLDSVLMAGWRRKPESKIVIHSDQGSQYTSHKWRKFLKSHDLEASNSRRGNCWDSAVAESFFQLLKRERIRRKIYKARIEDRNDIFDYIEFFYNSKSCKAW